jgi:hypothetical protein
MSFDKAYPNRKDRRRQYHGSKAFDHTCRPGGSCPACQENRKHSGEKQELSAKEQLHADKEESDEGYEGGPAGDGH